VKRLIVFLAICALWSLSSCGGGDGTRESCVGPYTGTFAVELNGTPLEGRLLAYLGPREAADPASLLDFRLTVETETTESVLERIVADVDDTGAVAPETSGIDLTGSFDFDACEASGTWGAGAIYTNGTWRLSSGHTAF
jgi:hypothetical protein